MAVGIDSVTVFSVETLPLGIPIKMAIIDKKQASGG